MCLSIALSISVEVTDDCSLNPIASLLKPDAPGWKQFLFCCPGFPPVIPVTANIYLTGETIDFDCGTFFFFCARSITFPVQHCKFIKRSHFYCRYYKKFLFGMNIEQKYKAFKIKIFNSFILFYMIYIYFNHFTYMYISQI